MSSIWSLLIGLTLLLIQIRVFVASRRSARERGVQWMKEIEAGDRGQQTRDSAILDLERALATCPHASLLRKLGVIAPLLGVTLTALAFMANTGAVAA